MAMAHQPAIQTRGFLFADLRDYTRFAESHGDAAATELLARYRTLVRDVIARFDGAEIRTEGDSFYVVFTSASAAVKGGLAILEAAKAASSQPDVSPIRVGVGVHAGEMADTPEGYVGSAVNIAARICSLAGPGELLASETVRALTRTLLGLQFVPRGRRRLKGIAEPIGLFRVLPATGAVGAAAPGVGARWRLPGWRLVAAAAVGLAGLLLVGAVLAGILPGFAPSGRTGMSTPGERGSAASADVSAEASAGATSSPLTTAEDELLAKLPHAVSADCEPASAAEGSAGGSVSLRCRLPLSADADEMWFDQFSTSDALARAFADVVAQAQALAGDCETTAPAQTPWAVPNVHRGNLLCYRAEGAAWLVWTYDDDRILARARRSGDDLRALLAWWRETAIFLR